MKNLQESLEFNERETAGCCFFFRLGNCMYMQKSIVKGGLSVKQKSIKTYKKNELKNKFEQFRKNRIIEYYGLVNLETSKPDFLRNSIADSSVKTCCFIGGLGFLNDS